MATKTSSSSSPSPSSSTSSSSSSPSPSSSATSTSLVVSSSSSSSPSPSSSSTSHIPAGSLAHLTPTISTGHVLISSCDGYVFHVPLWIARHCLSIETKLRHGEVNPIIPIPFTEVVGHAIQKCLEFIQFEWPEDANPFEVEIPMNPNDKSDALRERLPYRKQLLKEREKEREKWASVPLPPRPPNVSHSTICAFFLVNSSSSSSPPLYVPGVQSSSPGQLVPLSRPTKSFKSFLDDSPSNVLCELASAAFYLDIKPLVEITCKAIALQIKGKSTEEIRQTFNLTNDFTPAEEEQVRQSVLERTMMLPPSILNEDPLDLSHQTPEAVHQRELDFLHMQAGWSTNPNLAARTKLKSKLGQKKALKDSGNGKDANGVNAVVLSPEQLLDIDDLVDFIEDKKDSKGNSKGKGKGKGKDKSKEKEKEKNKDKEKEKEKEKDTKTPNGQQSNGAKNHQNNNPNSHSNGSSSSSSSTSSSSPPSKDTEKLKIKENIKVTIPLPSPSQSPSPTGHISSPMPNLAPSPTAHHASPSPSPLPSPSRTTSHSPSPSPPSASTTSSPPTTHSPILSSSRSSSPPPLHSILHAPSSPQIKASRSPTDHKVSFADPVISSISLITPYSQSADAILHKQKKKKKKKNAKLKAQALASSSTNLNGGSGSGSGNDSEDHDDNDNDHDHEHEHDEESGDEANDEKSHSHSHHSAANHKTSVEVIDVSSIDLTEYSAYFCSCAPAANSHSPSPSPLASPSLSPSTDLSKCPFASSLNLTNCSRCGLFHKPAESHGNGLHDNDENEDLDEMPPLDSFIDEEHHSDNDQHQHQHHHTHTHQSSSSSSSSLSPSSLIDKISSLESLVSSLSSQLSLLQSKVPTSSSVFDASKVSDVSVLQMKLQEETQRRVESDKKLELLQKQFNIMKETMEKSNKKSQNK